MKLIVNPQKNPDMHCGFTYSFQGNNIQNVSLENYSDAMVSCMNNGNSIKGRYIVKRGETDAGQVIKVSFDNKLSEFSIEMIYSGSPRTVRQNEFVEYELIK